MTVDVVAPGVRRVRAGNASPMTFTGTNSYLIGRGEVALIDPGPADPAHLAAILGALSPGERIAAILVTHAHLDHSGLAAGAARATGAPVLAFGSATAGRSARMQALAEAGLVGGGEGVDGGFAPDRCLADGEVISVGGVALTALHTPGHMAGHLSFAMEDIVFSGDLAMGWASTLISPPDGDLGAFLTSIDRLAQGSPRLLLPGHGEPVTDPATRLAWLADHRRARSEALLAALAGGPMTIPELTRTVYTDTSPRLMPAAERNVLAHLIDMVDRNQVAADPALTPGTRFRRL